LRQRAIKDADYQRKRARHTKRGSRRYINFTSPCGKGGKKKLSKVDSNGSYSPSLKETGKDISLRQEVPATVASGRKVGDTKIEKKSAEKKHPTVREGEVGGRWHQSKRGSVNLTRRFAIGSYHYVVAEAGTSTRGQGGNIKSEGFEEGGNGLERGKPASIPS